MAEMFHQRSGIELHGAGHRAGPIACAGLDGVVVVFDENLRGYARGFGLSRHLAAQRDPLAWGGGQVAAGADGLAIAALDAAVDSFLDCGRSLQVLQMTFRVLSEYDSR